MSNFVTLGALGAVTLFDPFAPSVPAAPAAQMTVTQGGPASDTGGVGWSQLLSLGTVALQATAPLWGQYLPKAVATVPAVQQILTPQPIIVQQPAPPPPAAPEPSTVTTYLPWALGAILVAVVLGGRRQ